MFLLKTLIVSVIINLLSFLTDFDAESYNSFHSIISNISENATYRQFSFLTGSKVSRLNSNIFLNERGASAKVYHLCLTFDYPTSFFVLTFVHLGLLGLWTTDIRKGPALGFSYRLNASFT